MSRQAGEVPQTLACAPGVSRKSSTLISTVVQPALPAPEDDDEEKVSGCVGGVFGVSVGCVYGGNNGKYRQSCKESVS